MIMNVIIVNISLCLVFCVLIMKYRFDMTTHNVNSIFFPNTTRTSIYGDVFSNTTRSSIYGDVSSNTQGHPYMVMCLSTQQGHPYMVMCIPTQQGHPYGYMSEPERRHHLRREYLCLMTVTMTVILNNGSAMLLLVHSGMLSIVDPHTSWSDPLSLL